MTSSSQALALEAPAGGYLEYTPDEAADYVFFTGQAVDLRIFGANGDELEAEIVSDAILDCEEIVQAHVFELDEGSYQMLLSSEATSVSLVVEEFEHDHEEEAVVPLDELGAAPSPDSSDAREVTAVLYATQTLGDLYFIANQLDELPGVQTIFPGQVLGRLIDSLGQGQRTYGVLANVILVLAVITVALNTYANALQAQKNLAVLRAVGVPRSVRSGRERAVRVHPAEPYRHLPGCCGCLPGYRGGWAGSRVADGSDPAGADTFGRGLAARPYSPARRPAIRPVARPKRHAQKSAREPLTTTLIPRQSTGIAPLDVAMNCVL